MQNLRTHEVQRSPDPTVFKGISFNPFASLGGLSGSVLPFICMTARSDVSLDRQDNLWCCDAVAQCSRNDAACMSKELCH